MIINTIYTIVSVIIGILINNVYILYLPRGAVNLGIGTCLTIGLIAIKIFNEIEEIKEKLDK